MIIKTIKLTSLFVNTENYRFEPLSSQKEVIDKMVEDQEDKLYSLVDDIVTNGLSPVDLIIVTPNEDNSKYIVLEGNRRITSLKLLNNPTLIDDKNASLRKKFQKLQKDKATHLLILHQNPKTRCTTNFTLFSGLKPLVVSGLNDEKG